MGNFVSKEPFDLKKFLETKAVKKPPRYQPFKRQTQPTPAAANGDAPKAKS